MLDALEKAPADFDAVEFGELPGFFADQLVDAWAAFVRSCRRIKSDQTVLRAASSPPMGLGKLAEKALRHDSVTEREVREYFSSNFSAFRIRPRRKLNPHPHGFVTGYYEPDVPASLSESAEFPEPVRGRPRDLEPQAIEVGGITFAAARSSEGRLVPYWSRAEIDAGKSDAPEILWVRDAIELFMIQVQGSARVSLRDGRSMRLTYDGRNGHPYNSIGRILVNEGHIPLQEMSLNSLKNWVRSAGQDLGQPGRTLLHRNPSYVFFRLVEEDDPSLGPIGGEGVPLTKLRSLAVDRSIWAYGLPFWVNGRLPTEDGSRILFQRMLIAQDTGSAIIGAARGDIFYGSGDLAGQAAALVRDEVEMFVLVPKG